MFCKKQNRLIKKLLRENDRLQNAMDDLLKRHYGEESKITDITKASGRQQYIDMELERYQWEVDQYLKDAEAQFEAQVSDAGAKLAEIELQALNYVSEAEARLEAADQQYRELFKQLKTRQNDE